MPSTSALTLFFIAFFAIFVASVPLATPLPRDVYSPPVLSPGKGTVWKIGQRYNVTWSMANAPQSITNHIGMIVLVQDHVMVDLDTPLAQGFDIRNATHREITVPKVKPGKYQVLLFGDSGNVGPEFTIVE
ncbi:hypothetical protein K438DRAFT_1612383 [Mycena galopus ATCC 62051]|nr:hypothetical protein K438DRAFT_1612383 [Mycena galopus ATCC 62051]